MVVAWLQARLFGAEPVQHRDAEVLIGVLAILEGAIWSGDPDEWTAGKVAGRFVRQDLLAADQISVTRARRSMT